MKNIFITILLGTFIQQAGYAYEIQPCLEMNLKNASVGTMCVTQESTFVRVEDGIKDNYSGITVADEIHRFSDYQTASEVCKQNGQAIPSDLSFRFLEMSGIREVIGSDFKGKILASSDFKTIGENSYHHGFPADPSYTHGYGRNPKAVTIYTMGHKITHFICIK